MDKLIKSIKELSKTPRGKGILFFAFYLVFFAFVFLFINLTDSTLTYGDDYERSSSCNINLDYIFTNNFSFKYDVNLDNNIYSYIGAKKDEEETIKFNNLEYYRNSNLFYINNNNIWVETSNPYKYGEYFDTLNIKKILENSYYVSKTVYETGDYSFNYAISSNTLNSILYGINTDYDEVPNEIVITADKDRNVNKISFNLDSLCKNNKICNYGLKINLEYDLFGEIADIINPLNK